MRCGTNEIAVEKSVEIWRRFGENHFADDGSFTRSSGGTVTMRIRRGEGRAQKSCYFLASWYAQY